MNAIHRLLISARDSLARRSAGRADPQRWRSLLPEGYERVYHYHTRKTAGTSLNLAIYGIGGEDGSEVRRKIARSPLRIAWSGDALICKDLKGPIEQGHYFFAHSHLPSHSLRLPSGTFCFTVVRHPVERLWSYYQYLLSSRERGLGQGLLSSGEHPKAFEYRWLGSGLEDFLTNVPRERRERQVYMFSKGFDPQEAFDRVMNLQCVLLQQDLAQGVQELGRAMGHDLALSHARKTESKADPTSRELELLHAACQADLALYEKLVDAQPE